MIKMKNNKMNELQFAVCINNNDYKASLEVGKIYRVIPDNNASLHGYLRIIDESGEDYGYSAERFFLIQLPLTLEKKLLEVL